MTSAANAPVDSAAARAEELDRHYRADVLSYCLRRLHSREEAEDAAQMIFLNAYRSLAAGTVPRLELAWLYSIAENVVAYKWRTISRRSQFEVPVDADDLAHLATTEEASDAPDLSGVVEALSELPAMERRAIMLREWRGFSYREVADELGVSNKAVERLLTRGRRGLRRNGRRIAGFGLPWPALKSLFSTGVVAKGLVGAASVALIATAVPLELKPSSPSVRPPVVKGAAAKPQRPARVAVPTRFLPRAAVTVSRAKHPRRASHAAPLPSVPAPVSGPVPVIAPDDAPPTSPAADATAMAIVQRSVAAVPATISPASGTLEPDGGPVAPGNSGDHPGGTHSGASGKSDGGSGNSAH